jgi:acyl-CoA reductase-like NAD-dependent aldehyde dehydrogenase
MNTIVQDILASDKRSTGTADLMLQNAEWAAAAYGRFTIERVRAIAKAVADAAFSHAGELAEAAVAETGFGVAAHKKVKNELTSRHLYDFYAPEDFCSARIRPDIRMVELPRPAGVIFALTPSTNPVCSIFYKVLLALLTRNAIILSPHPMARQCSRRAVEIVAGAAERAGAPTGIIQIIADPTMALIDHVMKSPRIGVILATGGTPMVRSAYSSGNPAIGVGPGNAPVLVDASADLTQAAKRIITSKSFDNSILCTNESVVIAEEKIADDLRDALQKAGAYIAKPDEIAALRELLFGSGTFNTAVLGKSAIEIGAKIGLRLPANTKVILTEIDRIGVDEPLSKEKLCPVLGFLSVPHAQAGITQARALIRLSGAGHSAAIHSKNPATILAYGASVKALRVVVNAPCSQGAAGHGTHLPLAFTIGTGFFGRSSVGENIGPQHLINWTRIAYTDDPAEAFGDFDRLDAWSTGPALALGLSAPISLGRLQEGAEILPANMHPALAASETEDVAAIRAEIRQIVLEELRQALRS